MMRKLLKNKGFTLAETIIVVMVIAMMLTMAFPNVIEFLKMQDEQDEKAQMMEIRRALDAYAKEQGVLPAYYGSYRDAGGASYDAYWYEELARYSNLSSGQIHTDVWGNKRFYSVFKDTREYRDATLDMYYAGVVSLGEDKVLDYKLQTGIALKKTDQQLAAVADNSEYAGLFFDGGSGQIASYKNLELDENEQGELVKFTDAQIKTDRYLETVDRLEKIVTALQVYSTGRYNEEATVYNNCVVQHQRHDAGLRDVSGNLEPDCDVAALGASPDTLIYNPASTVPAGGGADNQSLYPLIVQNDVNKFSGRTWNLDTATESSSDRRENMQALMRLLGLPESYCCSALHNADDGQPKAFYYYSNPRPRTTDASGNPSCGARPSAPPFLPARLVVDVDSETCG